MKSSILRPRLTVKVCVDLEEEAYRQGGMRSETGLYIVRQRTYVRSVQVDVGGCVVLMQVEGKGIG